MKVFFDCLGIYIVKKKDVFFMNDSWVESEVVVDPKNVDLIDYKFLNITEEPNHTVIVLLYKK